eukprot:2456922-Prorocentrum_lima.AAC.1
MGEYFFLEWLGLLVLLVGSATWAGCLAEGLWIGCGSLQIMGSAWLVDRAVQQLDWLSPWQAIGGWQHVWLKVPQACQDSDKGLPKPTSTNSNEGSGSCWHPGA